MSTFSSRTPGATSPSTSQIPQTLVSLPVEFIPVPESPFSFFSLPLELRNNILVQYVHSLPPDGQGRNCRCFSARATSLDALPLIKNLCYKLHVQFPYHAKFLPLLLTNRQMHDEFRPLRYANVNFHIIPSNDFRPDNWCAHPRNLQARDNIMAITPYLSHCAGSGAAFPTPLRQLYTLPMNIWNEIQSVSLEVRFSYLDQSESVKNMLQELVNAVRKRRRPLSELRVALKWFNGDRVPDWPQIWPSKGFPTEFFADKVWSSMINPLGGVIWVIEGAEKVIFQGEDYYDVDRDQLLDPTEEPFGEMRVFKCTNFTDFAKGMSGAEKEGLLETKYWHSVLGY